MRGRIDRLQGLLDEPLLVSSPVNVRYLSGLQSTNAALLVTPEGAQLYTDFRYAERARSLRSIEFVETRRNLYADLAERLSGRVAFEAAALTYERYETLAAGSVELVPRYGLVEGLRAVKDEAELAAIRRAAAIVSEGFERLVKERFVGRSERELAWRIVEILHELGAEEVAFPVIVATGESGASPHSVPGDSRIEEGQAVVVDAGCRAGGYCSDCTRTFATGPLSPELDQAYRLVLRAQAAGLAAVMPGAEGVEVDRAAREVIADAGLGERFGHGLGHGVGLEVHEAPSLHPEYPSTLVAGNVVTVEPGVYLPGLGGIRLEDMVLVRDEGPEVLTSFTRELVVVE